MTQIKIKKVFSVIKAITKRPSLLNLIINDNDLWQRKVQKKYHLSQGLPQVLLDDLFPSFSEELHSFSFMGGGSLPTDIALLKSLCRQFNNAAYFEIGTWRGESVRNVAEIARECYTLNLSRQQILDLGLSEKYADAHAFFSKGLPNVTHLEGDSRIFDYTELNKKFDVIFIDGNHHFDFVKSDTEKVFKHLIHDDSVVVWHDYAYHPEKVRFEVLHAVLDGLPKEFHANLYHVANTMCAIFIRGDFHTKKLESYENPVCTFEVSIKSKKV